MREEQESGGCEATGLGLAVGVLGFAWPFVVALFGIVLTYAGLAASPFSDDLAHLLLLCSFLGAPVVIACFYRWLPTAWPEGGRLLVAVLLAAPCILVAVFLAVIVFAHACVVE